MPGSEPPREVVRYPTPHHERVAGMLMNYFSKWRSVYAVVICGSAAIGRAKEGSDLDITVLTDRFDPKQYAKSNEIRFSQYSRLGAKVDWEYRGIEEFLYFGDLRVDLDFSNGSYRAFTSPFDVFRDEYELSVGNVFVHGVPVYVRGDGKFYDVRAGHLPYYGDDLRGARLNALRTEFTYKVQRSRQNLERGNKLSAFEDLLTAWKEYAQALFIEKRVYPVSYTKWLAYQSSEILKSDELVGSYASVFGGGSEPVDLARSITVLGELGRERFHA